MIRSIYRLFKLLFFATYDIVFVQREAFMLGTSFFEKRFSKRAKLIYDFDDSIWMRQPGDIKSKNEKLYFLKKTSKTSEIIKHSDLCIAGNAFLASYAVQFNDNVRVIPTTIDTLKYKILTKKNIHKSSPLCIGWTGSFSTIIHFQMLESILIRLKKKYNDYIYFKVIGDPSYSHNELGIKGLIWSPDTEVEDLSEIDIGLMPLPDDTWSKGKCACKALQYMALEIPCVASYVGVNTEVIRSGENGYLVKTEEEWIEKLSFLIENRDKIITLGKEARRTVHQEYSVLANRDKYIDALKSVM